jgi:hypothetical protein
MTKTLLDGDASLDNERARRGRGTPSSRYGVATGRGFNLRSNLNCYDD